MGRFNNLWASGKFAIKRSQEFEKSQMEKAVKMAAEMAPEYAVPENSREIFDALKAKRGQETGRWLNGLVPASGEKPMEAQAAAANAFDDVTMWINALCKEFNELGYEFNKKAIGTNLYVSVEKPKLIEHRNDDVWYRPVDRKYLCRLTTRDWSLIVRGHDDTVSIYVVPADMIMAFENDSASETEFPAFMKVQRTTTGAGVGWNLGGEVVFVETMPQLAKELFGDLIRLSSGVMSATELHSSHGKPLTLGENIAVGYSPQPIPVSTAVAQVSTPSAEGESPEQIITKACDIVDEIIDEELKALYTRASQVRPGTNEADLIRRRISATENFHTKILDAFKEYTHATLRHEGEEKEAVPEPEKFELLKERS